MRVVGWSRQTATAERQEYRVNAMTARPVLTLVALASAALALAAAYEGPRNFSASELLKPAQVKGPHFSVAPR